MKRTLGCLALAAVVMTTLPGCAVWHAYAQRAAVREARFSLRGVQVGGLDLLGVTLHVELGVTNPTASPLTIDQLTWTLHVNDVPAARGSTSTALTVPPQEARSLPLRVSLAYADLSSQVRQLLLSRGVRTWRIAGTARLQSPLGPFDYPFHLEREGAGGPAAGSWP
ncbi:MAG: LEA type 2 family protein [Candidatus Sericytochromatia bacterium]|nr:LEA type 2 family protein [Candidatus Sericytochromatia bacterium]